MYYVSNLTVSHFKVEFAECGLNTRGHAGIGNESKMWKVILFKVELKCFIPLIPEQFANE